MGFIFRVGEPVIYRLTKYSRDPGPRARSVRPSPHGETYQYVVDKFWMVREIPAPGQLLLVTRRGKEHIVSTSDPLLRHATLWERWWFADRFPQAKLDQSASQASFPVASPAGSR